MLRHLATRIAGVLSICAAVALSVPAAADDGAPQILDVSQLSSPESKLDYAKSVSQQITDADRYVQKLVDQASKEGVEEKISCVSGWHDQVVALGKVTEREVNKIRSMIESGNVAAVDSVLRGLGVLSGRVSQYVAQAETCAGVQGKASASNSQVESNAQGLADDGDTDPMSGDSMLDIAPPDGSPFSG